MAKMAYVILRREFLLGALDASVVFAYMASIPSSSWHGLTLAMKAGVVVLGSRSVSDNLARNSVFMFGMALLVAASSLVSASPLPAVMQSIAFLVHLGLTLQLLRPPHVRDYCLGVASSIFVSALAFVMMARWGMGGIENYWGRYSYFHAGHPNLGSELAAIGVVAAGLAFHSIRFFVVALPMALTALMMQGRAAMIVCICVALVRVIYDVDGVFRKRRLVTALIGGLILVAGLEASGKYSLLRFLLEDVIRVSDPYRGLHSGFAGRADSNWVMSWRLFLEHPIIGNGPGYIEKYAIPSTHNFFLYGLTQFGLLSLILFAAIALRMKRICQVGLMPLATLASLGSLLAFNDRFMNLNPYPFVFYVLLLTISILPRVSLRPLTERPYPALASAT